MTMHNSLYRIVHRRGVANDHNAVTAHSVVWNIRAMGNRFPIAVATSQTRYGYVIGTSGDRPDVRYQPPDGFAFPYDVDGSRSAPNDIVEGMGQGATLQPQSLYLDQLARRLGDDSGGGGSPEVEEPINTLTVVSVSASDHQDPNVPLNTLDHDLESRWSAQGNGQYIEFTLEEPGTVGQVWIAWFNGNERFFNFEIETSLDGVGWTHVYSDISGSSSAQTNSLQPYSVTETVAQYIRITGYGNTVNDWNSITAVAFSAAPPAGLVREWNFDTPGDVGGWTHAGSVHPNYTLMQTTGIDGATGVLSMEGPLVDGHPDPQALYSPTLSLSDFGFGYSGWDKIVFRARQISGTQPTVWSSSGTTALMNNWGTPVGVFGPGIDGKAITCEVQDDEWVLFTWDISSMGTGDLSNIRIDFIGNNINAGKNFEVDYIHLYAVEAEPVEPTPRPFIWVRDSDKPAILDKIANQSWAGSMKSALESRVAGAIASHKSDRDAYIRGLPVNWNLTPASYRTVPQYAENSVRGPTVDYFDTALECAVLYYLTGDSDYAALAADVLHNVVRTLLPVSPSSEQSRGGWIFQNDFLKEARVSGPQMPLVYDFLHDYLAAHSVYDVQTGGMVAFSNAQAQLLFRTYYELARDRGFLSHTNWHALMATTMLNNLLAFDDENEREAALEVYLVTGSNRQKSLADDYIFYSEPGNVWPESLQYADAVTTIRASHLLMIERYDPSRNLLDTYPNFILGLPRVAELVYPNGQLIRFGDGRRTGSQPYFDYELAYQHALAKERTDLTALFGPLINGGIQAGSHNRTTLPGRPSLGQRNELLKLLWNAPEIPEPAAPRVLPRTDRLPFAGISLQRNPSPSGDPAHGLMGFVGGAGYVHSHSSGMNIELYGLGHVLGAKGGRGTYQTTIHEKYYRNFAASNTIVVNGASRGMGGWANIGINTVQNVAMEPQQSAPAVSPNHSFSVSSFLDDKGTLAQATQQRTLGLVRTSPTSGFYVDIFRSNSTVTSRTATTLDGNVTDQYHDYIYRNVGEPDFEVLANGSPAAFTPQPNRFQNDIGDENEQPGWRYFENTRVTHPIDHAVRARFVANIGGSQRCMTLHLPAVATREFAKVESPSISDAPSPYGSSKSPTLVVRQIGSAWDRPFVTVFEPHFGSGGGTVQNVTHLERDGVVCGVKVESMIDGVPAVHYVINNPDADQTYEDPGIGLSFTGRFGIVADMGEGHISLYLGQGSSIAYGGGMLATSNGSNSQAEARFAPGAEPDVTANTAVNVVEPTIGATREDLWRLHYFETTEETGDAAMTANPDGDAYDNWTEYVLGTDPTVPTFDPPLEIDGAGDPLTLAFDTREATGPGYDGLMRYYTVQYSYDLSIWHELDDARDIAGTGQRVTVEVPGGIEDRRFFCLKVRLE